MPIPKSVDADTAALRSKPKVSPDHRTRVGAQRRERMRRRLLEAALVVFGRRGFEASVVDDIIGLAGVSRGTFYNYFRTNEELLSTVAREVANEVGDAIESRFSEPPDGPLRIASGIKLWLELVSRYPNIGAFFRHAGLYVLDPSLHSRAVIGQYMPGWVRSGKFNLDQPELLWDIVSGCIVAGINTVVTSGAQEGYAEGMTQRVLVALGVDFDEATAVASLQQEPLVLPLESLIERSVALYDQLPALHPLKQAWPVTESTVKT